MTAISKLQFSPFRANFCRGWAKPLICGHTRFLPTVPPPLDIEGPVHPMVDRVKSALIFYTNTLFANISSDWSLHEIC